MRTRDDILSRRWDLAVAGLVALSLFQAGCSKESPPPEQSPPATAQTDPAQPTTAPPAHLVVPASAPLTNEPASESSATVTPADAEPTRSVAEITRDFRMATNFDDRFEAALALGHVGTPEAVTALERLFRQEQDQELKVELVNALMGISGAKDERLRFLTLGIDGAQPPRVREAAIDGLVDLEDPRALPLLQSLFGDSDKNIRTLARQSHALAEQMLK